LDRTHALSESRVPATFSRLLKIGEGEVTKMMPRIPNKNRGFQRRKSEPLEQLRRKFFTVTLLDPPSFIKIDPDGLPADT